MAILCQIHSGWLELPLAKTIFHDPKPFRAIELYRICILTLGATIKEQQQNHRLRTEAAKATRAERVFYGLYSSA